MGMWDVCQRYLEASWTSGFWANCLDKTILAYPLPWLLMSPEQLSLLDYHGLPGPHTGVRRFFF